MSSDSRVEVLTGSNTRLELVGRYVRREANAGTQRSGLQPLE